jgi:hypothetical protein
MWVGGHWSPSPRHMGWLPWRHWHFMVSDGDSVHRRAWTGISIRTLVGGGGRWRVTTSTVGGHVSVDGWGCGARRRLVFDIGVEHYGGVDDLLDRG